MQSNFIATIIQNLLSAYTFLGYQYSHAIGNMSDEQFNEQEKHYLIEACYNQDKLNSYVKKLYTDYDFILDAEQISLCFNCSLQQAEQAVKYICND